MIEKSKILKSNFEFIDKEYDLESYYSKNIYIPLNTKDNMTYNLLVKENDLVVVGQVLGQRIFNNNTINIFSTVSGRVGSISKRFYQSGKLIDYLYIENDFLYKEFEDVYKRDKNDLFKLEKKDFIENIKYFNIEGLGGGLFPSFIKLDNDSLKYLIVNGVECEPYLSQDKDNIKKYYKELVLGIELIMHFTNIKKTYICVKKKYLDITSNLQQYINDSKLDIEIKPVKNNYPSGWENDILENAFNIKLRKGMRPFNFGYCVLNVTTIISIYYSMYFHKPLIYKELYILGDGIKKCRKIITNIGCPLNELIEFCGGYVNDQDKLIFVNGPMMGQNLLKDDCCITSSTSLFVINNYKKEKEEPCIRCASCVYSCPVGLKPVQIMNSYKRKDSDSVLRLRIKDCILCGMCSYTCTSKIHLTEYMRQAKKLVKV